MKRLIILILIYFTVVQSFGCAAWAAYDENPVPNMMAVIEPATAQTATCKNVPEQTRLMAAEGQVIPGVAIYSCNFGCDEATRLAKEGVYIGSNSIRNYIDLKGGNILLNAERDIVVGTWSGNIRVRAGAIAFIMASDKDIAIYDLLQTKPKQISVTVSKNRIFMKPERMLVLTEQEAKNFESLEVDCHRIAYRNVQPLDLNGQCEIIRGFGADFSVAEAVITIQPLRQLAISRNREDRATVQKMLKESVHFAANPKIVL